MDKDRKLEYSPDVGWWPLRVLSLWWSRRHDNALYRCLLATQVRLRCPPSVGSAPWTMLKPPGTSEGEAERIWRDVLEGERTRGREGSKI